MVPNKIQDVRFEIFMVVAMKNTIFWVVMSCGSCKNRVFGGMYHLHHQGDKNWQAIGTALAITNNIL
jgi:hypothetical protein